MFVRIFLSVGCVLVILALQEAEGALYTSIIDDCSECKGICKGDGATENGCGEYAAEAGKFACTCATRIVCNAEGTSCRGK